MPFSATGAPLSSLRLSTSKISPPQSLQADYPRQSHLPQVSGQVFRLSSVSPHSAATPAWRLGPEFTAPVLCTPQSASSGSKAVLRSGTCPGLRPSHPGKACPMQQHFCSSSHLQASFFPVQTSPAQNHTVCHIAESRSCLMRKPVLAPRTNER